MGLIESKGNMYEFITHTWNPIKGECFHNCSYCYMKKWGALPPTRLDEKELKTDLGEFNFIFVCSGCDMFADNIPQIWIEKVLSYCNKFYNLYFFQTKNPGRILNYQLPKGSVICTTIESNRYYSDIMNLSPFPEDRSNAMKLIWQTKYVTIEPILDFDLESLINMIIDCSPMQVNIGADSKGHNLPEPPKEKILELISELEEFTKVHLKQNLNRLIK